MVLKRARWLLCAAVFALPTTVAAQTVTGGQAGTVRDADAPLDRVRQAPPAPFTIERRQAAVADDESLRFDVRRIVIDGNEVLPDAAFAPILARYQGRTLSFADLRALSEAITALYAAKGYGLSFALIPEQTVADGIVHVTVIEGRIGTIDVRVEGRGLGINAERIATILKKRLQVLAEGGPARTADLERAALLIGDLPGVRARLVVTPSATQNLASDIVAVVEVDPASGTVGADNRLRDSFGDYSVSMSVSANSLDTFGDALTLSTRAAIDFKSLFSAQLGYRAPIGNDGVSAYAATSIARSRAQDGALATLDFRGYEETATLGLSYDAIRSRRQNLQLSAEFQAINTRSTLLGTDATRDRIRFVTANARYDWTATNQARAAVELGINQGIAGLGATSAFNPIASRQFATPDFTTLRASASTLLPIGTVQLAAVIDGEWTVGGRKLAAVECSYGGAAIGRAYYSGAAGGDNCLRSSVELSRPSRLHDSIVTPFVFFDAALLGQRAPLDFDEVSRVTTGSAGVGVRAQTQQGLWFSFVAAKPIHPPVNAPGDVVRAFAALGHAF